MGLFALGTGAILTGCFIGIDDHRITIGSSPAGVGDEVDFSAYAETGDDVEIERMVFRWDLDGDGSFETQSPSAPASSQPERKGGKGEYFSTLTSRSYPQAQTLEVASLVSLRSDFFGGFFFGAGGDSSVKTEVLIVSAGGETPGEPGGDGTPPPNQPPLASFTAQPNPARPEQPILFDASNSSDPDGSIARYEWDLDQSPGYERNTGTTPTTSHSYNAVGFYTVGLRVTDDDGAIASTTREVVVRYADRVGRVARRSARLSRFALTPEGRAVNEGVFTLNGDELVLSRAKARGTLDAGAFPKPLRGSHDVRWATDFVTTTDTETGEGETEAFVLLTFSTGGRACLGATVAGDGTDDPQGRFRVIGAIGKASRLHGLGTATGTVDDDGNPLLAGRARFGLGKDQDFGLGKSRCGKLRRLAPQRG